MRTLGSMLRFKALALATATALPALAAAEFVEIPAGTPIEATLSYALDSRDLHSGDRFEAELASDLAVSEQLVAPRGSRLTGLVSERQEAGRVEGREELMLVLNELAVEGGQRYRLRTSSARYSARGTKKRDAATVGAGTAVGAIIGAITEGKKGAAVGAVAGASAGTVVVLATRGESVRLAAGTPLDFTLETGLDMVVVGRLARAPEPQATRAPEPQATRAPEPQATRAPEPRETGRSTQALGSGADASDILVPVGTELVVRLVVGLDSGEARSGDRFEAELARDAVVGERLVARAGDRAGGLLTEVDKGGRVQGRADLTLALNWIDPGGAGRYALRTEGARESASGSKKRDTATVGATTAAGALIGAVTEGKKGAVVGAVVGAAAGGVVVFSTRGEPVRLPPGSELVFALSSELRLPDIGPAPRAAGPTVSNGFVEMPVASELEVSLVYALHSRDVRAGDSFDAELAEDLIGAGRLLAPRRARVRVLIADREQAGRVQGREGLALVLTELSLDDGRRYRLATSEAQVSARGTKQRDTATVGATTAVGALIGAVSEGKKGAVVGAVVGAAAGGVVVLGTRGEEVELPPGTVLTFALKEPVSFADLGPR